VQMEAQLSMGSDIFGLGKPNPQILTVIQPNAGIFFKGDWQRPRGPRSRIWAKAVMSGGGAPGAGR
jgi:hypothetical protein